MYNAIGIVATTVALYVFTAVAQTATDVRQSAASQAQTQASSPSKLSVHWEELSAAEFRDGIARAQGVCLLPFGILEKHGPHLPLGNDLLNVRPCPWNGARDAIDDHVSACMDHPFLLAKGMEQIDLVWNGSSRLLIV